jgi:hypothetical protein
MKLSSKFNSVYMCVCVCVCVCVYEAWSKSIWTDAVKLTKLNFPSGWTNPLQNRPHLLRYNYSSGLSAAGRTSYSLFWRSLKLLHCIKFNHFHNFISFTCQGFLNSEDGAKSHGAMSVEYKGWCTCGMWCLLENCCITVSGNGMNFSNSCLMLPSLVKIAWRELK